MRLYKTAEYRVESGAVEEVEKAMDEHAAELKRRFPGFLWWTVKDQSDPARYLTLIIAPDAETNEQASKSEGTVRFVDVLYPKVVGEVVWADWTPVAHTAPLPD